MDVKTFATELARSLTKRGIPKDLAIKHAVSLVRTFDEEDLREVASYSAPEEFDELANSLSELIRDKEMSKTDGSENPDDQQAEKKEEGADVPKTEADAEEDLDKTVGAPESFAKMKSSPKPGPNAAPQPAKTVPRDINVNDTVSLPRKDGTRGRPIHVRPVMTDNAQGADMSTRAFGIESNPTTPYTNLRTGDIAIAAEPARTPTPAPAPAPSPAPAPKQNEQEIYLDDDGTLPDEPTKVTLSGKGKAVFIGVCIGAFIPALLIAILVLGIFALGIVTVCAFIVASVILLCGETVLGCGATLVGVIYGAIEVISGSPGIGMYEIGLGIACGGAAMFLSILTYNLAVVAMPYILKQLIAFEGHCLREVGPMLRRFKERCAGI